MDGYGNYRGGSGFPYIRNILILFKGLEGAYFVLFGLAAIFFFSGMSVLPTGRNNRKRIERRLRKAEEDMEKYLKDFSGFPIPARYAHPAVLGRMEEIIAEKEPRLQRRLLKFSKMILKGSIPMFRLNRRSTRKSQP